MSQNRVAVKVSRVEQLSPNIKLFEFTVPDGLAAYSAGSHVTVHMDAVDIRRSYSLISDPQDTDKCSIAVLLDENSKGGSIYMHSSVQVGDQLFISQAENFFPLTHDNACKHILIAGGIGITPFLSYLFEIKQYELNFELHYCFRDAASAAFIEPLKAQLGDKLFLYDNAQHQRLNAGELISNNTENSHFYVCGPLPLIDDVIATGNELVGEANIHYENFGEVDNSGEAFEVHFQRSGFSLEVSDDISILQAIETDQRINIECLCRNGVCGTCETTILEGEADHRDNYLDEEEQAAQETIMICVSRAKGRRLVLDL